MYKSAAIYYDGVSSKPHEIELFYNEKNNSISFVDHLSENHSWFISSCKINIKPHILRIETNENFVREIKVENTEFIYHFNRFFQEGKLSFYDKLMRMNFLKWFLFLIIFIVTLTLSYYFLLPSLSNSVCELVPDSFDKEMGDKSLNMFLLENEIDSAKTKLMNQYLNEFEIPNKNKLKIYVVNSNEINAFALPNGGIIIFSEILNKINNHNELNALLCHEISHVLNRHSVKILSKNLFSYIWISLIFSDANTIQSILLQNAYKLQNLSYSREFEKEADINSVEILKNNGLALYGIIDLLNILNKEQQIQMPQFLSTHPAGRERIKYNIETINKNKFFKINIQKDKKLKEIWELIK